MDASCYSPGKEYKNPGKDSKGKYFPGDYTTLKEGADDKSPLALFMHNSEKMIKSSNDVPSSFPRQKSRLFRGGKKLSRNMWASVGHEKTAKKNRFLKAEKSMDDTMFLPGKTIVDRDTNFDTVPQDICLGESFANTSRRGSICEELEKKIFSDGISLHELRKAMVIEETLKERFLM